MTFEEKIQNLQDVKCIYEEIVNTPNCVIGIEPCEFDQLFDYIFRSIPVQHSGSAVSSQKCKNRLFLMSVRP